MLLFTGPGKNALLLSPYSLGRVRLDGMFGVDALRLELFIALA